MEKKVCIAGAGLVGSLLSIYLAKKGYSVDIYERRPDMRKSIIKGGRSINLALSDRGWRALEAVGVAGEIRKVAIPMKGRMVHYEDGNTQFLPYGKEDQAIYSVSRSGLNEKLMDLAEAEGNVNFLFNYKCEDVNPQSAEITFEDTETSEKIKRQYELVFGADGAFSAVRLSLMLQTDRFNYNQHFLEHGYKELVIPSGADGIWQIEKNALHIWPRKSFMLIALPNLDGSFTCTLFLPFNGDISFEKLNSNAAIMDFFKKWFPDAVPLMPTLTEDFNYNPTSSLVTVRCDPWVNNNKVALIGDAAHAIVPFYGQGMNAGFEDCYVLDQIMTEKGDDWEAIFERYAELRKPDGDAIAELALRNFIEMRDLVADKHFLAKRKLEKEIADKYPEWIPAYSMVTFSKLRYSEALTRTLKQEAILEELVKHSDPLRALEQRGLPEFLK